ncbi:hypothetical protein C8J56DRAFT_891106 [Mycena floridula]|nr:hypothetical protein C8J56DRAFT_891106 [Mycena floridula]
MPFPIDIFCCLSSFSDSKMLKERTGYKQWAKEFQMVFGPHEELFNFITTSQSKPDPNDTAAVKVYTTLNTNGRTAIYKTIESASLQDEFVTDNTPVYEIWADMKAKLAGDTCSSRHDLLALIFNPIHDPSKEIFQHYVQPIVSAAEAFGKLVSHLSIG